MLFACQVLNPFNLLRVSVKLVLRKHRPSIIPMDKGIEYYVHANIIELDRIHGTKFEPTKLTLSLFSFFDISCFGWAAHWYICAVLPVYIF